MTTAHAFWHHEHSFGLDEKQAAEQRTHWVIALTLVTMIVELVAGYATGSMALTADGWHMGTHAAALGLAAFAYAFARRHANNPRFTFGSGKAGPLGGFASAIALALIALLMAVESIQRLITPIEVEFSTALLVAVSGLVVNLASAWLLGGAHHHHHGHHDHHDHDDHHDHHAHDDHHDHHDHHQDHNLRGAYLHVLADALTSLTAIVALICGMTLGWIWMDPLMGIIGSIVIGVWSYGLIRDSAKTLMDAEDNFPLRNQVRQKFQEYGGCEIVDLHLWRVSPSSHACIISLITHHPQGADHYKSLLHGIGGLDHITVEVNHCRTCP
ncbi:MAG: CDF family Co(II)/Ni(II) efflux transporter DmeF [Magnetococcales bacterium]|nr:CDF family Co(II)/Ni(II) efflux transporter DmeF [Magnetococcales bacterium]